MISNGIDITPQASFFLAPEKPLHRQYEALRAYFVEGLPSHEVARRFGYSPGAFRVLCHEFRHCPDLQGRFFRDVTRGPQASRKRDAVREQVVALRKQNLSVYDIQRELEEQGHSVSVNALSILLREEGFARLPRRRDDERPVTMKPIAAPVADVRLLDLSPRRFHTSAAGLFLFAPLLVKMDLDQVVSRAGLPGTEMIPATYAVRTMLALKLLGKERTSHVMEMVFDPGIALFAGLNAVPKRSYLAGYSSRVDRQTNLSLLTAWIQALKKAELAMGSSFDLDFHSIPANSTAEPLDKHYISGRSRSQTGVLSFLARDAQENVFCYGNAGVPKSERDREILRFADFWKDQTGSYPEELIFDSQLTTYAKLSDVNERGIAFITLRRRSKKMLARIYAAPASQWRRITLPTLTRQYRTPRVLDEMVDLPNYQGKVRQLTIMELGHEEPTILLTNQMRTSAVALITRYAQRMLIESGIAEAINFFHMDALTSMVGLKVDFDLQLTIIAGSLYHLMAHRIGKEYRRSTAKTLFRKLFDVSGSVAIDSDSITVELARRAHNPFLADAGLLDQPVPIPWLEGRNLVIRLA